MSEAETVAELSRRAQGVPYAIEPIDHPDGTKAVILVTRTCKEDGVELVQVHKLDEYFDANRTSPVRRKGSAILTDLESFIGHANRFKDADSVIFAERGPVKPPSLTCVLDYHQAGASSFPRFGQHRSYYAFPISDEWSAWNLQNGKMMAQEAFAAFLEDRLVDVLDPASAGDGARNFLTLLSCAFASPSKLLELSRGLSVHVGAKVQNHANLATGESVMHFATEHSDGAGKPLKVPGAFLVGIPVFRGGAVYQIAARLRYRVGPGSVMWSYELYRAQAVFDDAIAEACALAKEETGLPLLMGAPE